MSDTNCHTVYSAKTGGLQGPKQTIDIPGHPCFQFSILTYKLGVLATKTIFADGTETGYDSAKNFWFRYRELEYLEDFAKALEWMATEPRRFIIRGQLLPELDIKLCHYRRILSRRDGPATLWCPPRWWIVLDLDGVMVPHGLGAPDKVAEAGYFIRDNLLPGEFRSIRCVVVATSSTGRKGADKVWMRMFFLLSRPADNDVLYWWTASLSAAHPELKLDPSVIQAMQPIYTARPIFRGMADPVPSWGRVRVLDGGDDYLSLSLARVRKAKKREGGSPGPGLLRNGHGGRGVVCTDVPEWLLDATMEYEGPGPDPEPIETSDKAWLAIRRVFEMLDGCSSPWRHKTLTRAAWELVNLVNEGELTKRMATKAYLKAAKGIDNSDGKYDREAINRRLRDAFADITVR
jgi:hypothetical protein